MDSDAIVPPSSPPLHATFNSIPSSPFFDRPLTGASPKSSSPPPLFSSDDSRESEDIGNYESPRIRKKRKGAWFLGEPSHITPEAKKSKMARNFDSGIYMMSDVSDSMDDLPIHQPPFPEDTTTSVKPRSYAENQFCLKLDEHMEANKRHYDFSGQHNPAAKVEDEDISRIGALASVIAPPGEGEYRSMVPEIYLDFSDNLLCRMTPSLFNVGNITSLNLRNNSIRELPSHIANLRNLRSLNVSHNKLKWLPYEILDLVTPRGPLEVLSSAGNPMMEPVEVFGYPHIILYQNQGERKRVLEPDYPWRYDPDAGRLEHLYGMLNNIQDVDPALFDLMIWHIKYYECVERPDWSKLSATFDPARQIQPTLMARTLATYLDQIGEMLPCSPKLPEDPGNETYPVIVNTKRGAYGVPSSEWFAPPSTSAVPSLLTTSLINTLKKRHLDDLSIEDIRSMMGDNPLKDVEKILDQAQENDRGGFGEFRKCHTCRKEYIVPRAQWVEFWNIHHTSFIPVMVKVCSWGCVPEEVLKKPEHELVLQEGSPA